ncbi:hypothetical protein [Neorhizobium sp. NCHU2750]|uniref:hypothetical protein n=1 Tax=Neorhizobium sp. NCHU2750 TaxID=1825976 RepID=UPI000E75C1DB|nr:hypothetical protein NCHU2750_28750 [Neorhizobium sp. NCHU2750]
MPEIHWIALGLATAVAGGGVAARFAGIELWKGFIVGGVAAIAALLASFAPGIDRNLTMPMAALIAAGIAGSTVGLTAARTAPIVIGAAVPPLLGMLMLDMG